MARTKQINKELKLQIGRAIRECREAAGLTQAQLAEAIDQQPESISRIETGLRPPTLEKLVEMANLFHVPPATFFEQMDGVLRQPENDLYAQKISAALDKLPDVGKAFVLDIAQSYGRHHSTKPKKARGVK